MASGVVLSDEPVRLLAAQLGCAVIAPLAVKERRQTWHVRRASTDLVLKCWAAADRATPYTVVAHRLLAAMEGSLKKLILPRYLYDGHDATVGHYVMMSFIPGDGYADRWHYTKPALAGGLELTFRDIDLALNLIDDLGRLSTPPLVSAGLQVITPAAAVRKFHRKLRAIVEDGILSAVLAETVGNIVNAWDGSGCTTLAMLSNADFRHLNFIRSSANRVGIIDWDDAQASTFEIEHCVAYQWLFLWNRPDLEARLIRGARARFGLDHDPFRALLLIRAVTQVHTCRSAPDRVAPHLSQISRIVDEDEFALIWGVA